MDKLQKLEEQLSKLKEQKKAILERERKVKGDKMLKALFGRNYLDYADDIINNSEQYQIVKDGVLMEIDKGS